MEQWLTSAAGGTVGGAIVSMIYFLVTHVGCRCHRNFERGLSFDVKYNKKKQESGDEADTEEEGGEANIPSTNNAPTLSTNNS